MSSLPVIDEKYTTAIFTSLMGMDVPLDDDPLAYGPKRLNGKVALCRGYLDRCQRIYLQVSTDLHALNRHIRSLKVEFDLQIQDMFVNDPETRAGRNVRDREAIATMKLRGPREDMAAVESSIQDLDSVLAVVKAKRDDLRDVQGRIRDQLKLCQEELNLGSRWGSRAAPGQATPSLSNATAVDPVMLAVFSSIPGGDAEPGMDDLDRFTRQMLGSDYVESSPDEIVDPDVVVEEVVAPNTAAASAESTPDSTSFESPPSDSDAEYDILLAGLDDSPPEHSVPDAHVSDIDLDDLLGLV